MASLQARHRAGCALGAKSWTKVAVDQKRKVALAPEGCSCDPGPNYYVVATSGAKGGRRSIGRNARLAFRELTKTQSEQDTGSFALIENKVFGDFADEWFESLRRPNANTLRSYVSTVGYAKRAFGTKQVRKITVKDIEHCLSLMTREVVVEGRKVTEPISASTQAKHLRVLSAMFKVAIRRGYATVNPVEQLDLSQRPQVERNEAPYFTNDELPRLRMAIEDEDDRALIELALSTGMRLGELLALRWSHVDLLSGTIHVREAHKVGLGVSTPKSKRSVRDVELTGDAVKVLEGLYERQGGIDNVPADGLLFPPKIPTADGYTRGDTIPRYVLYPAMERAGIKRSGEDLTPPTKHERTFHSLRHTYARIALEKRADLTWLSRQMGHSSTQVTEQRYGHWSKEARKREAAKLEGAFSL